MHRLGFIAVMIIALSLMTGCVSGSESSGNEEASCDMKLMINDVSVAVEWENNQSVNALREILPLTVNMHRYGGFEQVGEPGRSLPRSDTSITTNAGDIVLYSGNQLVIFYGSNTWAYTRLGKITDRTASQLRDMLSNSDAVLTLSAD